jgi:hypothetical protein
MRIVTIVEKLVREPVRNIFWERVIQFALFHLRAFPKGNALAVG